MTPSHMADTSSAVGQNAGASSPPAPPRPGVLAWAAAAVLVAGSMLFLYGGRSHPAIGASLGSTPEAFFHAFASKVLQTHDWHGIHLLILIGPLCWAVAAPALLDAMNGRRQLVSVARSLLVLSGALWTVAFVLDGFGAPIYAAGALAEGTAGAGSLVAFEAAAVMMSRLGLVSWVTGGLGMLILAGMLLEPAMRTPWRVAVGVTGMAIGAWPLLAALEGEYARGPFTSGFWMMNALVVGLWYVALASCAFRRGNRRAVSARVA